MAFILNRLSCLLALVMTLQYFVPFANSKCLEFQCYCCRDSAGPLPALSPAEEQAQTAAHDIIVNFTRSISVDKPADVASVHPTYLKTVCPLVFNWDLLQSLDSTARNRYANISTFERIVKTHVCRLLLGHSCTDENDINKVREYCLSFSRDTISEEFVSTMAKPCIGRLNHTNGTRVSLQHRCQAHSRVSYCVYRVLADYTLTCPSTPVNPADCTGCN